MVEAQGVEPWFPTRPLRVFGRGEPYHPRWATKSRRLWVTV
jgi:hypothetical protein